MAEKKTNKKEVDLTKPETINRPKTKKTAPVETPKTTVSLFAAREQVQETNENKQLDTVQLLSEISGQVFNTDNIKAKTVLNKRQVVAFSKGEIYGEYFDISLVKDLVKTLSIFSISEGGLSRKQMVTISQSILSYSREQEEKTLPKHLMGIE